MGQIDIPGPARRLTEAERRIRELEQRLEAERAGKQELSASIDELHRSSSWRLTAPLRKLAVMLRGRPRHRSEVVGDSSVADAAATSLPAGIPEELRRPELDSLEAINATCRRINLYPGLEGLADEELRAALGGSPSAPGGAYRGWRGDPPGVAFIGSSELAIELSFDARVTALDEDNWREILKPGAFQFLVVETVWHVGHRNWRYAMSGGEGAPELRRLFDHARDISMPLVVWFRESPGNSGHFAWLAGEADLVCVADASMVEQLRRDYPNAAIEYAAPAVQPALHNPLRSQGLMAAADMLRRHIVFDGWWDLQGKLPGRERLRGLAGRGLLVAESLWDFAGVRLDDSGEFRDCTIGCLDAEEKLAMMRLQGAEVFTADPLAGAWRSTLGLVRAAASGSLVARLDGGDPDLPELRLPGAAGTADPLSALTALLDAPLERARWSHLAWRGLMSGHTVAHRLQQIAEALGTAGGFLPRDERIAVLLVTMRPERLPECIERFRNDAYPQKELVIVIHGDEVDLRPFRRLVREGEPIRILRVGRSVSLGACLNLAASHTDAPFWTKWDDDDLYGTYYLGDMMLYQRIGNFKVFGKPPVFNYLESGDDLLWDVEWARHANLLHEASSARAALVAGGTLGGRSSVLADVPFCERRRGGSDSDFVRRCYEAGFDVLGMDGFNFIRCRSAQTGFHTWTVDEDEFRARSLPAGTSKDVGLAMC